MTKEPLLSAILVTPDRYETVRRTVLHLAAQSIKERIEVVVVAPASGISDLEEAELAGFDSVRLLELPGLRTRSEGFAAGIRRARAPVVVLCEDHCYPEPGWAEALVRAHRDGWTAVGPVVANANPGSAVSWADYLLGYGPWIDPAPAGPVDFLPGHNSSYKRDRLLAYDPGLETWLEAETHLHWDMRSRGHGLYLEPAARVRHFNFSRVRPWLLATFHHSRTFAGRRFERGPRRRLRRAAHLLAFPLIGVVRFRRSVGRLRRARQPVPSRWVLPATAVAAAVSALGEAIGYALGPGSGPERVSRFEYHRDRDMNEPDRIAMASAAYWSGGG